MNPVSSTPTPPPAHKPAKLRCLVIIGWDQEQAAGVISEPRAITEMSFPVGITHSRRRKLFEEAFVSCMGRLHQREKSLPERVMCVSYDDAKSKKLFVFGEGWYVGDFIPDENVSGPGELARQRKALTPKILLDGGVIIYGCECHWGIKEAIESRFAGYEFVPVSIEEARAEAKKSVRSDPPFKAGDAILLRAEVAPVPAKHPGIVKEVVGEQEGIIAHFLLEGAAEPTELHLRPEQIEHAP